jgi:murein L,D-transpeptidase YafK
MKKAVLMTIGGILLFGTLVFIMAQPNGRRLFPAPGSLINQMQQPNIEPLPPLKKPRILIKKQERQLFLYDEEKLVKTYNIALGFAPEGDKEKQGDGKTPEGEFYIFTKNPKSRFYLSLGVSYPSIDDAARGLEQKLITRKQHDAIVNAIRQGRTPLQNTALGGEIYIHGGGSATDWTLGCVALTNEEIKELFDLIPVGTKVSILP